MKKQRIQNRLPAGLSELARQLQRVKAEAERIGIFTDNRELLECSKCGLKEDVDVHGFLLTCYEDSIGKDTGLRFKEGADSAFRCPKCRSKVFADEHHLSQRSH